MKLQLEYDLCRSIVAKPQFIKDTLEKVRRNTNI